MFGETIVTASYDSEKKKVRVTLSNKDAEIETRFYLDPAQAHVLSASLISAYEMSLPQKDRAD